MMNTHWTLATALLALGAFGDRVEAQPPILAVSGMTDAEIAKTAGAPLFQGMGDYNRKISTESEGANRFFNQGMVLAFGFNHAESIRSFRAAQRLDPECAMCFWGEALATGPNINVTSKGKAVMSDADRKSAFAAINRAMALKDNATPLEQALIEAQAKRYNGDPATERPPLDLAYAEAMGEVVAAFPEDDDTAAIYSEALMNTMPWDYWSADGTPKPETQKVIAELERVIARSPQHPLALHLYLHAVEASAEPGRAEDEADMLSNLVPGSGHLVHMPAHIYWRVGRYDDAATANVRAAAVDEEYIAACNAQGFYPAMYYPHNIHFLWAATSMAGQSRMALDSAYKVAANVRMEQIEQFPTVEFFKTIPLLTLTQFGRWSDILAESLPPTDLDYSNAIWRYARGMAMANTGNIDGAQAERAKLAAVKDSVQIRFLDSADYPASVLLNIADDLLQGEMALKSGNPDLAVSHFERAVAKQDSLPYTEPPFWYYPTRQSLGQALLEAGRPAEAEAVYRKDLEDYPHNGWSMSGLATALEQQGKMEQANMARAHFEIIWAKADVKIRGSRL
ncbi:MAG: tetratricopeptide (TPR) repeat protein [Parasphingorhabdus sp.]|jgi:tetratricopeptide (TPR) repeat protein|uniref:tetratricopeptide repeat protein n=1 Tax=Parasphingorhabdus sp. TaxID=2709688 RepID=UPI0039E38FF1